MMILIDGTLLISLEHPFLKTGFFIFIFLVMEKTKLQKHNHGKTWWS